MKRVVRSLLDSYREGLKGFAEDYAKGLVKSDVIYQKKFLEEILAHSISCIDFFKKVEDEIRGPRRVFVILPGNVPVTIFQILPILLISGVEEVFFKYPRVEKTFYQELLTHLNFALKGSISLRGEYLSHSETLEALKEWDFVIAYGGEELVGVLNSLNKPARIFGPKFSIGILEEKPEKEIFQGIARDNLSFDTRGCLSLRFLFTFQELDFEGLMEEMEKVGRELPPQSNFNLDATSYEVESLALDAVRVYRGHNFFVIYTDKLLGISASRVLVVIKVNSKEHLKDLIWDYRDKIQGVASLDYFPDFTSASFFAKFGQLQFPPCGWFFEKGVDLKNFWEVPNV